MDLGITGINPPSNVTFVEGMVSYANVTDPVTGNPIDQSGIRPTIQTIMNVTNADLGAWRIQLNRQPTDDFIINVDGTVYGPPVTNMDMVSHETVNNQVDLTWTQAAEITTTVSIYATQDAITTTASYTGTEMVTDANGIQASQVVTTDLGTVTQFGGSYVGSFTYLPGTQTLTESVDLSSLPSGTYHLWLDVDDSRNPPTDRYFPGTVTVFHDWQATWQANVSVTPALGGLTVAWDQHPNPDVDGYEIEVSSTGDVNNPDSFILDVGQSVSQTVTGLSAQQTYSVTVVAYDSGTDRSSTPRVSTARPWLPPSPSRARPTR